MKYVLDTNIALRSWDRVPCAYYRRGQRDARALSGVDYEMLKFCDGETEIPTGEVIMSLVRRGLCHPAEHGERLTTWQKAREIDNRYFPAMNWMITGKCNYNCLHCFNAKDNSRLTSEFTLDEARTLIRDAAECGINAVTLTGGEPMVHPDFLRIVEQIYTNGMYVNEINTNGSFLTSETLDALKSIGCMALMKISFDGIGYHDWMRGRAGAEKDAIAAIERCVKNGFEVKAQTNVNRRNVDVMLKTAKALNALGVKRMRIIRTTEAPRWRRNAGDSCLTLTEYYDSMLKFASEYAKTNCKMSVDIWQFLKLYPRMRAYDPVPVMRSSGEYRKTSPVCRGNRGMVAIGAEGNVYPCLQLSGKYIEMNDVLGNVKAGGLKPLLQKGRYIDEICTSLGDLREHNAKCGACEHFESCCGGCRALAYMLTLDKLGHDPMKCLYFDNGYLKKTAQALEGWRSVRTI